MKYNSDYGHDIELGEMDNSFFLIGILNVFMNRYQIVADKFFGEISWKQCFLIICIQFFKEPPTIKEVADIVGTSHQNVKQMLIKLERLGFVEIIVDETDKRKQRIILTKKAREFSEKNDKPSAEVVGQLFSKIDPKDLEITAKTILKLEEQLRKMK